MRFLARFRSLARLLFHRSQTEREMDAELRSHLESRAEDLVRSGLSHEEAFRQAHIEFGGVENFKEVCRGAKGANLLESLFQDLRYAFRMLRKSPAFTAVAVLTLALGIGANTAIFSVVYAVLLKPLPYTHPEQLYVLFQTKPQDGIAKTGNSFPDFEELQEQQRSFSLLAGAQRHDLTLTGRGDPAEVDAVVVTPGIFSLLDAKPLTGRTFYSEDGAKGAAPVALISESLWRSRFGAAENIIGSGITLDQRPFTIVGIMPANFRVPIFPESQDVWIPIAQDPLFGGWTTRRGGHWLPVLGRLKPDVTLAQAQAEMDAFASHLAQESPAENSGWSFLLSPLQRELVGDVRAALFTLLAAVGLVLLIACVNIANLLLARATSRAREVALRRALGAARARVIRQLLTESALLGFIGAVFGILVAWCGVRLLTAFLPPELPQFNVPRVDAWVLAFAVLLAFGASLFFGLAPALLASRSDVQSNLKEGSRSGETGSRLRARSFLAASEIALAVVLVVAAGLLLRSFASLTAVDPGFVSAKVSKVEISLPQFQYSTPQQWTAFSNTLLERVQAQPGLRDAALAVPLPLADGNVNLSFDIAGAPPPRPGITNAADYVSVSPEYFHVMSIPLIRGRAFSRDDAASAPRVTVINQAFARLYFPSEDPLGKHLVFAFPPARGESRQIVGVVGDVRDVGLHRQPGPMMYVPFAQAPFWGSAVVVKSALATPVVVSEIRRVVQGIDRNLPITNGGSMSDAIAGSVAQPRFRTWLLSLFGLVALALAAIGIFGVISYSVSRRTQEFGVRIALGATSASIREMVLKESLRLAGAGVLAGLLAALGAAQFLKSQLYGVGARDPLTFAVAVFLLLAVALAAAYLPARRATRVDPLVALRYE